MHERPRNVVGLGLEIFLISILQHQFVQAHFRNYALQLAVFLLQLLLAALRSCLSVRHRYFNLPQQVRHLLWTMLLSSYHLLLSSFQSVSSQLGHFEPSTPVPLCDAGLRTSAMLHGQLH